MKIIVGLGNTGDKYENTRHNVGFMVLDRFLKDTKSLSLTAWTQEKKFKSDIAVVDWQITGGKLERLILVKPLTQMNNSGIAVKAVLDYYKISPEDLIILNDDLDIQIGKIKIKQGGTSAGHRGVESVINHLGTEQFLRFRFGIGLEKLIDKSEQGVEKNRRRTVGDVEDYVLGKFGEKDSNKVREMIKNGSIALTMSLEKGIKTTMTRFNTH